MDKVERAREMLERAYLDEGMGESLAIMRELGPSQFETAALRAIEAALEPLAERGSEVDDIPAPWTPTEAQWGGLARQIMMWLDFGDKRTPRSLFRHLEMSGTEIPQWLRDEPEMKALDHVPSKGTRCVLIYRAMLASLREPSNV